MSSLTLSIPARLQLLPLATAFAEHGATSFGFSQTDAMSLGLAAEEVLAALSATESHTEWSLTDFGAYAELHVRFPRVGLQLASVNLARPADSAVESDIDQIRWLLASRAVDRFKLDFSDPRSLKLILRKYRTFPEVEGLERSEILPGDAVEFRAPTYAELHLFCRKVLTLEDQRLLPPFLSRPEQLQVMIESGQVVAELGFTAKGDPVAGLLARAESPRVARLLGPYLIDSTSSSATELLHRMVRRFAKTSTQGLFCEGLDFAFGTSEMERLGRRVLSLPEGESFTLQVGYRTLTEDEGMVVWSSPTWNEYLQERYHKLCLPREVKPLPPKRSEFEQAVLTCDIQAKRSEVLMRPVVPGPDATEVLGRHVELFREEEYQNILFALDVGVPEQMYFSEALHQNGFVPCYLVPNAGKGDVILFQVAPT